MAPRRMLSHVFARRGCGTPPPSLAGGNTKRCGTCRGFSSEDPTLAWARAHPEQAQGCLLPPVWDARICDDSFKSDLSTSLEGYLCWRKWTNVWTGRHDSNEGSDELLKEKTLKLCSHVLSAPLTLANFLAHDTLPLNARVACIGARAEATIPLDLWKEFLLFSAATAKKTTTSTFSIDFVGPDVITRQGTMQDQKVMLEEGPSLVLRWLYRGLFHDLLAKGHTQTSQWDALVFYNPGFGHPHLRDDWKQTLDRVLGLPHPMLLTAHSEMDAERDMQLLRDVFGLDAEYQENPFASQISYQDPFDKNHFVRPNHYVAHVGRRDHR
jgi:hypothetical protein